MKVLHVSYMDDQPGANRAAYRLHKALQKQKVDSSYLVLKKVSNDAKVIESKQYIRAFISKIIEVICEKLVKKSSKPIFSFGLYPKIGLESKFIESFDIIHLHWLGRGTLDLTTLIPFRGPIVWRLPDMYPFTAGCHYSNSCTQYIDGCKSCHYLQFPILTQNLFEKKNSQIRSLDNLHIVSPSHWLHECTLRAKIFQLAKKHQIATGVDTHVFKPSDKLNALKSLGLTRLAGKKIILFGAISSTSDIRKGSLELCKALEIFNKSHDKQTCELVIFGSSGNKLIKKNIPDVTFIGHFADEKSMSLAYNICDLIVVPSLEENLPNTAIEALSCGKPVVAFDIGGLKDLVQHKLNGYLAKPFETEDLAAGINWVLKNLEIADMSKNARQTILNNFDETIISKQYLALYTTLLKKKAAP